MRKLQKILTVSVLATSTLLISGCSIFPQKVKPVEVVTKPIERAPLNLREPKLEGLTVPHWVVITPENSEGVWTKLSEKGNRSALFALTDDGYQELAVLMSALRGIIAEQKMIIQKYKEYYEQQKEVKVKQ